MSFRNLLLASGILIFTFNASADAVLSCTVIGFTGDKVMINASQNAAGLVSMTVTRSANQVPTTQVLGHTGYLLHAVPIDSAASELAMLQYSINYGAPDNMNGIVADQLGAWDTYMGFAPPSASGRSPSSFTIIRIFDRHGNVIRAFGSIVSDFGKYNLNKPCESVP